MKTNTNNGLFIAALIDAVKNPGKMVNVDHLWVTHVNGHNMTSVPQKGLVPKYRKKVTKASTVVKQNIHCYVLADRTCFMFNPIWEYEDTARQTKEAVANVWKHPANAISILDIEVTLTTPTGSDHDDLTYDIVEYTNNPLYHLP